MFDPASQERVPDPRLRGMNPAFVKRVWEKRRLEKVESVQPPEPVTPKKVADPIIYNLFDDTEQARRTADQIIRDGARVSGFRIEDIKGNRRYRPLVKVRQSLMARVYVECPHLSLPQIGRAFGGRDHTTILHAVVKLGIRKREFRSDKKAA